MQPANDVLSSTKVVLTGFGLTLWYKSEKKTKVIKLNF